jgi:hypothetical protein
MQLFKVIAEGQQLYNRCYTIDILEQLYLNYMLNIVIEITTSTLLEMAGAAYVLANGLRTHLFKTML